MLIKKILNNNAVITLNDRKEEIVVMGKAIAYGKKAGDDVDVSKIQKCFEVCLKPNQKKMMNMLKDIPIEYMEISDQVIQKARKELNTEIDDLLYITLTDHIHSSIERFKDGIPLKNQLIHEIKHFYKDEYELGLWTLELIKEKYDIEMPEDEAGFIAMHIVSSEVGKDMGDVYEITNLIQEVLSIVKLYFQVELDENSLSYYRFVTHLKYFGKRIFTKATQNNDPLNQDLLEIMKEKYIQSYLCSLKIKTFIEERYNYVLESEECLFLTIHIAKVIQEK
ncbi:BglG family transcription antiterminator LicT [Floccifex sp.]|uniref:BglG family transcription antiterminator LicT n=1 Tax=Floccifex sp. TaxID=2815810 RepID=UPI003EFFE1E1